MHKWNAYIMVGNLKIYLRKAKTTKEIMAWMKRLCKCTNNGYFMYGIQVFFERR